MNPVERAIRKVDATQQRNTPMAFIFGVVKKYGDDNGGVLVSNLAYSAFVSLFPLLLVLVTILGLVASVEPSFRTDVLNAVAGQVPLIGHTLTENVHQLQRASLIGLIVGLLLLIWGATGLAQAGLFTMEQVWNLPGPARPGYVQRLGRAGLFLCLLGGGVIVTTGLASLSTYLPNGLAFKIPLEVVDGSLQRGHVPRRFPRADPEGRADPQPAARSHHAAASAGRCFRSSAPIWSITSCTATPSTACSPPCSACWPGSTWPSEITVYSAEINVVLARRLWPRSIVQPPLTEADRASMALQALQNQRRPEQDVEVTFNDRRARSGGAGTGTPQTPDEVTPPGDPPGS